MSIGPGLLKVAYDVGAVKALEDFLGVKVAASAAEEDIKRRIRVAILEGSTGDDSRSRALARAYGKHLMDQGADVDTIDMRELGDLPDVMTGDTSAIEPHLDRFRNADAFVIASPVYNWGPSGKVNHFLDLALDRDAMAYKPYSLLSGAGSPRSALALGGLANQLDMELKGIGIGAGVQAAGDDYNESTGRLKKDIINRARDNASKLLQVASALRNSQPV
jgi:NAD(P)H-dependent FMN reductase